MKDTARITMVQLQDDGDGDSALERMKPFFAQAVEAGSDLVVFPEYILGQRITTAHPRVRAFFDLARRHNIYAVAGMVESHGDRWSTSALMVDRGGSLLGRYLKCHAACGPEPHWWPPIDGSDGEARGILGNTFKVFHLDFGTVGIIQCYDGYFPESWGCTSFAGAEVVLWINGRDGMLEDGYCQFAAQAYGCVVGANVSNGCNTGFASPWGRFLQAPGEREEARLFPRIKQPGDACVHATIDMRGLRWHRKHLRTAHQRRPELYGLLTQPHVKLWHDYPEIEWDRPECGEHADKAELPPR